MIAFNVLVIVMSRRLWPVGYVAQRGKKIIQNFGGKPCGETVTWKTTKGIGEQY